MGNLIEERRSIRRFLNKKIDKADLDAILRAARWAPSWGNRQCAEIIVITSSSSKEQLSRLLSAKNPATKGVENAPVVLAVCGNPLKSGYYKGKQVTRYSQWFLYDLGIVSQNICLRAWELGIGSVIVGSFEHGEVEKYLNIPNEYQVVSLIPLGYPDHQPPVPKRRELNEFVHYEKFM